ncbi:hypothetical protein AB7M70_011855 [Bradyrhizobium japonicum]
MAKIKRPSINETEDLRKQYSYPEELELNTNRPLTIGVRGPYEFIALDEKTFIVSSKFKEKFVNREKGWGWTGEVATEENMNRIKREITEDHRQISNLYNPFQTFDIEHFINTLMSIDLKDKQSVLNFYNTYGPIGTDGTVNSSSIRETRAHIYTKYELLDFFEREITTLKHCIQLFEAIQNNDEKFLNQFRFVPTYNGDTGKYETTPNVELAKRYIINAINANSDLMNPVVFLSPEGELMKGTSASCLLGVFYLRLYELVTENPKIKKCHYCGDYFIPRKSNANFCPPPEANERSKCANRYDAMVRRIAEWHYKDGLSVEEIQKKLTKPKSRSLKEINHILGNYTGKLKK